MKKDSSKMETAFKAEEKPIKSSFILFVLEMRVYGCGYGCQMVGECVSEWLCDIYQHADIRRCLLPPGCRSVQGSQKMCAAVACASIGCRIRQTGDMVLKFGERVTSCVYGVFHVTRCVLKGLA